MNVADVKDQLLAKRKQLVVSRKSALSTGSTLLNLACTDLPDLGFVRGCYYYLVGDSTSGKTWLSLTCFAEACLSSHFKDYRLIFDDVEGGALMNIEHYFGKEVARRMEPPARKKGEPVYSDTVESFYYNISDVIKAGKPFIYVLDSQDALTSSFAEKKFAARKTASETGEEAAGSYGDGKAKFHSENIRWVVSALRKMGSILIIIGQTRDNMGMGFDPKTRSGGKALRFYATTEIWTSVAGKIKKTVREKERTVGVYCQAEVKKNRVSGKVGKDRSVQIPIYYGLGIDDVGSCVDFLIAEKHWPVIKVEAEEGQKKDRKKAFNAHDILFKGSREKLIRYIEEEDLEAKVKEITSQVWREIEDACEPSRKRRYV